MSLVVCDLSIHLCSNVHIFLCEKWSHRDNYLYHPFLRRLVMANMSDYLENKMIDHLFRGLAYPVSTTLYVALSSSAALGDTATGTTMSEITGGAYARQAVVATTANWYSTNGTTSGASSGTNGTTSNVAAITFPTATADWGTVQAVVICDS